MEVPHLRDLNKNPFKEAAEASAKHLDRSKAHASDRGVLASPTEVPLADEQHAAEATEADKTSCRRRLRKKTNDPSVPRPISKEESCSYASAWSTYVRGNVVTEHAAKLIKQMMAACCGKSTTNDGNDVPDIDIADQIKEMPANVLPLARIHAILDRMSEANPEAPRKKRCGRGKRTEGEKINPEELEDVDEDE